MHVLYVYILSICYLVIYVVLILKYEISLMTKFSHCGDFRCDMYMRLESYMCANHCLRTGSVNLNLECYIF